MQTKRIHLRVQQVVSNVLLRDQLSLYILAIGTLQLIPPIRLRIQLCSPFQGQTKVRFLLMLYMAKVPFKIRTARQDDIPALDAVINQHRKVNIDHYQEIKNPKAVFLVAEKYEREKRTQVVVGAALMWQRIGTRLVSLLSSQSRRNTNEWVMDLES